VVRQSQLVYKRPLSLLRVVPVIFVGAVLAVAQDEPQRAPMPRPCLKSIGRVYIETMPNDLDQYLRAEITKAFKGKLLVVLRREDADAVMAAGVGDYRSGVGPAVTGRWLGLHDTANGSVSVLDKQGRTVLWSSVAGDRNIPLLPLTKGGIGKVAERLIRDFKKATKEWPCPEGSSAADAAFAPR
jgi:hypothetical protein